jgi:thymidylate synthase
MASFPEINENPMAPTCCHAVWNQFQVRDGQLHMNAVFRSTDAVLGLPHNFVQHRALQLYFAHHAGVPAANSYQLYLNDVHIYDHPDHNDFVSWLLEGHYPRMEPDTNDLIYTPSSVEFKAEDFTIKEELRSPLYTQKIERTL